MIAALTRRRFLSSSGLAALVALQACGRHSHCVDPATLGRGEEQMRKTLEYVDVSGIPGEDCAGCRFFYGSGDTDCGDCELLAGPVSAAGYCTSWAS